VTRVLHLRNADRFGGPERLILEQAARATRTRPVVVTFARPGATTPFVDALRARGVETVVIPQAGSYDPRIVGRVREAIARTAAEVLVGHDYKANLVLAAAARGTRLPRAAVVHGYTAEDRKVAFFEAVDRRLLRRVAAVVAVSAATRAALRDAGVPADRVHMIENAVDVKAVAAEAAAGREAVRASWSLAPTDLALVALGRFSPEKGHATLVEAFHAVARAVPRARLVLVGDGVLEGELRRAAAALPADRVVFAGWRTDPARCLGAADVFVLPSLREGLPLAVLEALAAGVPVCASAVGGVPDALDDGACGTLVPPGDPSALADALVALLSSPDARARTAAAGRARVRDHFDAPRQAARLEALWTELHSAGVPGR